MKTYLHSLSERDRWALILGVLCLLLYIYYVALYRPLRTQVALKASQFTEKTQTLSWMKQIPNQGLPGPVKNTVDNAQLLTLMDSSLKESKALLFPYQLQQTTSGDIELHFEQVPFNPFMVWLSQFNKQYQFSVKHFEAQRSNTPGMVRLLVVVSGS